MLVLFMCLVFCGISNGEYSVKCGRGYGLTFVEAGDGVEGRYRMEWCTLTNGVRGQGIWNLNLRCNPNRKPEDCRQYNVYKPTGALHSRFDEDVLIDLNCTYVCFSTNLDLIFNGACYTFKTALKAKTPSSPKWPRSGSYDYVHYVHNNYSQQHFTESEAIVNIIPSGDHVTAEWFLGYVPATEYTMSLCVLDVHNKPENCTLITSNCSTVGVARTAVSCRLWPPPRPYQLSLEHNAPWSMGEDFFRRIRQPLHNSSVYVAPTVPPVVAAPASAVLWWALGGVLALAASGGAALLLCRSHLAAKLRERVAEDWPRRRPSEPSAAAAVAACDGAESRCTRVLLLYARDCAPMMAVAAQLRALLQYAVDHVYDVYSAEVVAEAARAPGEWLRRVVARADVRVLLLQTPAAACLHAPALIARGAALQLEQPLLNRRVTYRVPHSSDSLLPLALRLLADTAHTTHSYKKFYIATIEGVEAELVREVTPLRRYLLPAAAALLLSDLADGAPPLAALPAEPPAPLDAPLGRLADAVRALHDYVRAKPDYLDEELIFYHYDT